MTDRLRPTPHEESLCRNHGPSFGCGACIRLEPAIYSGNDPEVIDDLNTVMLNCSVSPKGYSHQCVNLRLATKRFNKKIIEEADRVNLVKKLLANDHITYTFGVLGKDLAPTALNHYIIFDSYSTPARVVNPGFDSDSHSIE